MIDYIVEQNNNVMRKLIKEQGVWDYYQEALADELIILDAKMEDIVYLLNAVFGTERTEEEVRVLTGVTDDYK